MVIDDVNPFSLVEIVVGGAAVYGRPVEWNKEIIDSEGHIDDGSIAKVTMLETVCPQCGQMVLFNTIYDAIQCPECSAGEDVLADTMTAFMDPGKYGSATDSDPQDGVEVIEAEEVPIPDVVIDKEEILAIVEEEDIVPDEEEDVEEELDEEIIEDVVPGDEEPESLQEEPEEDIEDMNALLDSIEEISE